MSFDEWSRLDVLRQAIEDITGPTGVGGAENCGGFRNGACRDRFTAVRCGDDGETEVVDCTKQDEVCGYSKKSRRWTCVQEDEDLCEGLSPQGICADSGNVVRWCDPTADRPIRERRCGDCGQSCMFVTRYGGAYCRTQRCGDMPDGGRCVGNTLDYCNEGQIVSVDCGTRGQVCTIRGQAVCAEASS